MLMLVLRSKKLTFKLLIWVVSYVLFNFLWIVLVLVELVRLLLLLLVCPVLHVILKVHYLFLEGGEFMDVVKAANKGRRRRKMSRFKDRRSFSATASRSRKENFAPMRGGIRL